MNNSQRYLYRGVSIELHQQNYGRLVPKTQMKFEYAFKWGEGIKYGSGATYGTSTTNAVIRHQLNQQGFPTSGVSTTPLLERAKYYATQGGKSAGVVYVIDPNSLAKHGVQEHIVSQYAVQPSVPEDDEVILVASDLGPLPQEIVVQILEIN